jgi:hypothetical protein
MLTLDDLEHLRALGSGARGVAAAVEYGQSVPPMNNTLRAVSPEAVATKGSGVTMRSPRERSCARGRSHPTVSVSVRPG